MAATAISGYELVELLAEGPRATVYKARDRRSGNCVALKLFHTETCQSAERLRALEHPYLARFCDMGRAESQSYIVWEYLPGGTLKDHIRSLKSVGDRLPADQILVFAVQIAEALTFAHGRGFAHDNVKSANVMFSENGTLKLTDFAGTAAASEAEKARDLEAFGRLLYEMAAGEAPLPAVSAAIELSRSDLPAAFQTIVTRILEREREDRYTDLESVLRDLKSASLRSIHLRTTIAAGAASHPAPPALAADRILAGRFRIVKFIARGGMGDVYEAEDLELRERVALKTVRPEIAGASEAIQRFKREIQLARKVTHPNVCRIFDIFHDQLGSDEITFLTMELLNGETLHQRILRSGKMSPEEALPIIRQMADGLAAAHRAGVIHRDFKSANVMLTDDGRNGQPPRAVITDFGLARPALEQEAMTTVSTGGPVGTPAYMAPEQLENREVTSAADIYAFGIVLYEMLTGTLPFVGGSSFAVALKRLQGPPPSLRIHVPELEEIWEAAILRCLEIHPAARFNTVDDVVEALAGETAVVAPIRERSGRRDAAPGRRRVAVIIAAILFTLLVAGALTLRRNLTTGGFKSRPSIAVLGFKNLTGQADAAWLSTALSEMLTTELAAGERVRTIPGESVARMEVELSLTESSGYSADTLARIRSYLGADVLVYGTYVVLNGPAPKVRMDLRLQDSVHGNLLATVSETGDASDLLTLVARSGAALREKLGIGPLRPVEADLAQAALPATPQAARHYAEGLDKLRVFDALGARDAFGRAVAEDGRHALAHAGLATAWSMLGYSPEAKQEAQLALNLSSKLNREDQLVVEGRAREAAREWQKAAEVYRTLFGFFPDNLDYGLRLANAATSAGNAKDALATIATLRQLPAPDRDSPLIDLAEARAAGARSDFKQQQAMAARAAAKAQARGAKLLLAGSRLTEGMARTNLGQWRDARALFEEARDLYSAAGDRWDAVNASTNLAYVALQANDLTLAESLYQQSLATYRELGDRKDEAAALTSIGTILRNRGELARARQMHEAALAIRREIGDRIGEAMSLNNLANISSLMGDSKSARNMYQSALPVFREIGDQDAVATVLSNLADLVSEEGDLARARDLHEESRATFQNLGKKSSLAYELSRIGDLDLIDGDLQSAQQRHAQALELRNQLGDQSGAAENRLALAQIALHQGDAASAEAAAQAAADEFALRNRPDEQASAMALLARSLFARGKYAESIQAVERAEGLSKKSGDRDVRLSIAITGASIRAARGDSGKSLKDLEAVIRQAHSARSVRLELEARLAMAEIQIAVGQFRAARATLEELQAEAAKKGYKFVADRAAAAKKKIPALTA
jgi:serine/threonine protein kinase/TolB-like protein